MRAAVRCFDICLSALLLVTMNGGAALAVSCTPTPWDEVGPFYRQNAPVRSCLGRGYVLSGTVRSAADCRPLPNIRIEVWQAGPGGEYDDGHRATLYSDHAGRYHLETDVPPPYGRRPPHIHILVDAKGFEGLVTQHYPGKGKQRGSLDLVIVPETDRK
ncbi:MAG: intradiol ring-cleavage dioxygenase [Desulfuromonadaceae bacterium]|nr:intradiol ring-cleavage dioxygenase [Desulfuromonadaceae bacterium]